VRHNIWSGLTAALLTASVIAAVPTGAGAADRTGATPKALARESARQLIASKAPALKVGANDAFTAAGVTTGGNGLQYVAYSRTFKGLPVYGGDFVVNTDEAGHILGTSVAQTRAIGNLSTTPAITKAQAAAAARTALDNASSTGTPGLLVYALGTPRLAWRVQVSGLHEDGDHSVADVYVDAKTAEVIASDELLHYGSGSAYFNGPSPLTIDTTQVSTSSYSMKDPNIGGLDCRDDATGNVYTGADDSWGDGTASSKETGCVDALFALQTEDNMLSSWLGRNSFDGSGNAWQVRVGKDEVNAFYCPPGLVETGYCDGTERVRIGHNQANTKWLTNLDVVGHEYGHGIDEHTPGGHSGGNTSEFVADVFGALTESYANESSTYDEPDYTVGEEVDLVGAGPIRYMYKPSLAGDPDCYSSSIPTAEVHAAAGPGNHWFYLLAEGTAPTGKPASPTCNSTSLTGIGLQKAGKIFYNAMLLKTTSSSYLKYRTWTLTAAKNLYPGSCAEFNAVKAAWNAVSVPAQTGDPTCTTTANTVTVNNPGSQTGTVGTPKSLQITATDSASGETLTYSATGLPAGLTINSSTGLISGTPTTAASYTTTVTAKDSTNASGSTTFGFTISGTGGGTCTAQTNDTDVAIADNSTVESPITISGCSGNASSSAQVAVNIVHTYIGDLKVDLVAPDGSVYTLHNHTGSGTDNINTTYPVDLSSEAANGTWKLRVNDNASQDTGYINSWTLTTGAGGGTSCAPQTNGTNVTISDNTTVESPITIAGCSGNATATAKVAVSIVHTYIGDLEVDLVAPDGSVYVLHNHTGSGTDNINTTYPVDLSSEAANGTWKLRVTDNASQDTGYIDTWTLTP